MGDARLIWAIFVPIMAALLSMLSWLLVWERSIPRKARPWLELGALSAACAGLLVEGFLLILVDGPATLLGLELRLEPVSLALLLAGNFALLCSVFVSWEKLSSTEALLVPVPWAIWGACLSSSFLAATLLVRDSLVQVLCLFGVGLLVSALALLQPRPEYLEDDDARTLLALRVAGGLKYLALSAIGTGLLVVGVLVVASYAFSLENSGLLQIGLAVLAVGLSVRSGLMPFSVAFADMLRTVPGVSILALGAALPATLVLGLLLLSPVESSNARASSLAWLGAIGALLAGLRALSATQFHLPPSAFRLPHSGVLVAMTVALSLGWGMFGVLSGSRSGAVGASLLGINMAFAVPLLVAGNEIRGISSRLSGICTVVGTLSLLGFPPFGGAAGTLRVAQSAVNMNGIWLAVLLLGSLMTAGAWLGWAAKNTQGDEEANSPTGLRNLRDFFSTPLLLLVCVLLAAQPALFFASERIAGTLAAWANVPWTLGP